MTTYEDLGVHPFINASGTITTLGGSLMPPEVLAAMEKAAQNYVDLNDLHVKAGEKLAAMIGVPGAFISCGAASGMQLAAAACLTGTDREKVRRLPHVDGKNEFVVSKVDSHFYVHQSMECVGGKLVWVGTEKAVTTEDIVRAIGPHTAAAVHFLGKQTREQLREVLAETQKRGVPVIVDAAAQLPPRSNLTEIVGMGAALVVFSGGKGMRGPQCTGLVVGTEEMVEAARLNSSPWSAVGRGHKVGKEEIMGLLTAVELFLAKDEAAELAEWERIATRVVNALDDIPGVTARVRQEGQRASPAIAPRAYVRVEPPSPKSAEQVLRELREGEPSIVARRDGEEICIDPMTLNAGEEAAVGRRLREVLR